VRSGGDFLSGRVLQIPQLAFLGRAAPSGAAYASDEVVGGQAIAFQAMRLDYHKLVRDGIPRIIEAGGGQPVTRVLDQAGYLAALRAKLMEEAEEAQAASDSQLRAELADVLEVLQALATAHGMSWEHVVAEATRKRGERGGFDQRIFLEYVDQAD